MGYQGVKEENMEVSKIAYEQKLIANLYRKKYFVRNTEDNGYNTHITFFKRPGRDGSGFETDVTALKNIIKAHVDTKSQNYELTAVIFNEVTFHVFWMEHASADNARKMARKTFGTQCMVIERLPD
jgi:hypothetical protein